MTTLQDLFLAIKEENLTKDRLEGYHKALSELRGQMRMELAEITKRKAVYLLQNPEISVAQRKITFAGTPDGQREIELKAYIGAVGDNLNSVKSRLYSIY